MKSVVSQLSLHKLQVFCEVADAGSVSVAAERLGISQPVVTHHLKGLAEKLACQLTRKEGRHVVLTEEGQRVLQWAREVTRMTRQMEHELQERGHGLAGTASIVASMSIGSYVLPSVLAGFQRDHPRAKLSLEVTTPSRVIEQVREGNSDAGFTILDPGRDLSGLSVRPLMQERLLLVGPPERFDTCAAIPLEKLHDLNFVTAAAGSARRLIEEQELLRHGIGQRNIVMEVGHAEAIKRAVRSGAGVALLFASSVREELAAGTLTSVTVETAHFEVPVYRIQREGKPASALQQRLIAYLETELSA